MTPLPRHCQVSLIHCHALENSTQTHTHTIVVCFKTSIIMNKLQWNAHTLVGLYLVYRYRVAGLEFLRWGLPTLEKCGAMGGDDMGAGPSSEGAEPSNGAQWLRINFCPPSGWEEWKKQEKWGYFRETNQHSYTMSIHFNGGCAGELPTPHKY